MAGHRSFRRHIAALAVASATAGIAFTHGAPAGAVGSGKGPSSSETPYLVPVAPGVDAQSILTSNDDVPLAAGAATPAASTHPTTYRMAGIPDGLGAFDNGDGTYTVIMNHEIPGTSGIDRPGDLATGAFLSKLVIRKADNAVLSGEDAVKRAFVWNRTTGAYERNTALNLQRFCSADLPAVSAFYNAATGKGTQSRIFMNGEESGGVNARALGHIVTGPAAGDTYELPRLGLQAWENELANPATGDKTVVLGLDDTSGSGGAAAGQVFLYVGDKQTTGTDVEKAGLTNGGLWVLKVPGLTKEDRTFGLSTSTATFSAPATFASLGDVTNLTQAQLDTAADAVGTDFLRPEDGVWDPQDPNVFYFQTTDRLDTTETGGTTIGRSRVWRLTLTDRNNPTAGGTIDALVNGDASTQTGVVNMLDNLTADGAGHLILLEDVGNAAHNGKMWQLDLGTKALTMVAKHDPARFGDLNVANTPPYTQDEEFSGIIPAFDILGPGWYLTSDQSHTTNAASPHVSTETVEDGQLLAVYIPSALGPVPNPGSAVPEVPMAAVLPLAGLGILGTGFGLRRRGAARRGRAVAAG